MKRQPISEEERADDRFFAALLAADVEQLEAVAVASRYTHVLVRGHEGGWRLISAQGTPIVE